MAELSDDEKDRISHRGGALRALRDRLSGADAERGNIGRIEEGGDPCA
jgi:hypothetical protein